MTALPTARVVRQNPPLDSECGHWARTIVVTPGDARYGGAARLCLRCARAVARAVAALDGAR